MDDLLHVTKAECQRLEPFLDHTVDAALQNQMALLRTQFLTLAVTILREQPASRSQSLALTQLEATQMRAIQGLALQGVPQLPPGVVLDEEVADAPEPTP